MPAASARGRSRGGGRRRVAARVERAADQPEAVGADQQGEAGRPAPRSSWASTSSATFIVAAASVTMPEVAISSAHRAGGEHVAQAGRAPSRAGRSTRESGRVRAAAAAQRGEPEGDRVDAEHGLGRDDREQRRGEHRAEQEAGLAHGVEERRWPPPAARRRPAPAAARRSPGGRARCRPGEQREPTIATVPSTNTSPANAAARITSARIAAPSRLVRSITAPSSGPSSIAGSTSASSTAVAPQADPIRS